MANKKTESEETQTTLPDGDNQAAEVQPLIQRREASTPEGANGSQEQPFEQWVSEQGPEAKNLYDEHIRGLKSALERVKAERNESREELQRIKKDRSLDAAEKVKAIEKMLEEKDRKLAVYESLALHVNNIELAWAAVQSAPDLIEGDGSINLAAFQERFPQLFNSSKVAAPGLAGVGTNSDPSRTFDMNGWIRSRAKRN